MSAAGVAERFVELSRAKMKVSRVDVDCATLDDLWIRTKAKTLEKFTPNDTQVDYLDQLCPDWRDGDVTVRGAREIVLKGRQEGLSTLIIALIFMDTINNPLTRSLIIAHDLESTQILFEMVKRFYTFLPDGKKRPLSYSNRRELHFADIDSGIYIGTAGRDSIGRGSTINNVHMSERAMWREAVITELDAGLLEAVPVHGNIWKETTARGLNHFHRDWREAETGESDYIPRFFPWHKHKEYRSAVPVGFTRTPEEDKLVAKHGLDDEQLVWRRAKRKALKELLPQEYPMEPKEAFVASTGWNVFDVSYLLQRSDQLPPALEQENDEGEIVTMLEPPMCGLSANLIRWAWPEPKETYIIAGDPASGIQDDDHDYTSFDVLRERDGMQVAHYHGRPDPLQCARDLYGLSVEYNGALVIIASNGLGLALVKTCEAEGVPLWGRKVKRKLDGEDIFTTEYGMTATGEAIAVEHLRTAFNLLAAGGYARLIVNCDETIRECVHYVDLPGNRRGGENGWHDDRVRSLAMGYWYIDTQTERPSIREDREAREQDETRPRRRIARVRS